MDLLYKNPIKHISFGSLKGKEKSVEWTKEKYNFSNVF